MDAQDYEMPSPKRQRTNSPPTSDKQAAPDASTTGTAQQQTVQPEPIPAKPREVEQPAQSTSLPVDRQTDSDMLDVLMQHVESEATAARAEPASPDVDLVKTAESSMKTGGTQAETETVPAQIETPLPPGLEPVSKPDIEHLHSVANVNNVPATAETLLQDRLPPATSDLPSTELVTGETEPREWETDSSFDSSDSSDSTDSSDDDSDDSEADEYTLLNPYEQARILMAESGGAVGGDADSDDEGNGRSANRTGGAAGGGSGLRSTNEQVEAILPKPEITVTEDMKIEELGNVQAIVENIVLVKAKTSGEYQVLEAGSVLCLQDRSVVGAVSETLGRVEEPLYTVRFASLKDIEDSGVSEKGTTVFYVRDHSTFVFTQPLKAVKGSDASNLHDEEIGDDEIEFSDDEAEAEHKRQMKLRRKGIDPATVPPSGRGGRGGARGGSRGGRGASRGGTQGMSSITESDPYTNSNVEMNYDDVEEGEADYTPLRRPDAFSASTQSSPSSNPHSRGGYTPQRNNRGHDRGNSRGGGRGRGRGSNHHSHQKQTQPQTQYAQPSSSMYANHHQQQFQPPSHQQQQYFQQPFQSFPPPPPPPPPSTGAFNFDFASAATSQWQQYHQNQNNQFQHQQAQYGAGPGTGFAPTQVNADAIAQVQRQLEEMRRQGAQFPPQQGGNGWQ